LAEQTCGPQVAELRSGLDRKLGNPISLSAPAKPKPCSNPKANATR